MESDCWIPPTTRKSCSSPKKCWIGWRSCRPRRGRMGEWLLRRRTVSEHRRRTRWRSGATKASWVASCRERTLRSSGCHRHDVQRIADAARALKICTTIDDMRSASRAARHHGKRLGFVPTMGALHEGHLSLVRAARASCDIVTASIFVNPAQFGPNEDLEKYPRSFERDWDLLEKEGVDVLFAPSVEEMYPAGAVTWVTVEELSGKLDGRSRPGHFRGVTTIVAKLCHVGQRAVAFVV